MPISRALLLLLLLLQSLLLLSLLVLLVLLPLLQIRLLLGHELRRVFLLCLRSLLCVYTRLPARIDQGPLLRRRHHMAVNCMADD